MSQRYIRDLMERVIWTGAQAAAAAIVVGLTDAAGWWVVPLASLAATLKGLAARKVGDPESASTVE